MVKLSKVPVVRTARCTFEVKIVIQLCLFLLLCVVADVDPVDELEAGGQGDLNNIWQEKLPNWGRLTQQLLFGDDGEGDDHLQ